MLIFPDVVIGELLIVRKLSVLVNPIEVTVPPVPAAGTKPIISDIVKLLVGFSPLASDVSVPISKSDAVGVALGYEYITAIVMLFLFLCRFRRYRGSFLLIQIFYPRDRSLDQLT